MTTHTDTYKAQLLKEKEELLAQLKDLGVQNADNPDDWNVKGVGFDIMEADQNEAADRAEEIEENESVLATLAARYTNITSALTRIEEGTYGICSVCGEDIEDERLAANPAAQTCKKHLDGKQ